jgi:hypothetical protein
MKPQSRKPNFVFVLMDNLGYGEVGVYGGGITRGAPTPRIDQLAGQGMRLTNFNVEAECTPSRSAIMTGRFSIRFGTHSVPIGGGLEGLTQWEVTIAEALSMQAMPPATSENGILAGIRGACRREHFFWGVLLVSEDVLTFSGQELWEDGEIEVIEPEVLDPVEFARTRLKFEPDERQIEVLRSEAKRGILNCTRQWGKSTIAAAKAVHRAFTRPKSLVLVASPTDRQSGY